MKLSLYTALLPVILFISVPSFAQTLNERQIYERCSARLTRMSPDQTDPFVPQIEAGTLTGAAACSQLLALAKFGSGGVIGAFSTAAPKRALAERVLTTMNSVHVSWLSEKTFVSESGCRSATTNSLVDPLEPALHFTRALFGQTVPFSYVVNNTDNLRAVRSENNPTRNIYDTRIDVITNLSGTYRIAANGQLLGISSGYKPIADKLTAYALAENETRRPTTTAISVLKNQGGGIIGSQAYLLNNFGEGTDWVPDLEKLPRNWSKWVFKDLLCRELPVLFLADAPKHTVCADKKKCGVQPTVAKKDDVLSFRQNSSCVQCHATMDQMLGVTRNLRSFHGGRCNTNPIAPPVQFVTTHWVNVPPTLPLDTSWDYAVDPDYRKRQPNGRLYFRDIYGKLVDLPVKSIQDIGTALGQKDDMYICAAKRYYQYFTGIDVELLPLTAAEVAKLPPDQKFYRDRVFTLGKSLRDPTKYNQSAEKLIQAIFALPEYKMRDFRLVKTAQGK